MAAPTLIVLFSFITAGLWGLYCGARGSFDDLLFGGGVIALVMMVGLMVAVK